MSDRWLQGLEIILWLIEGLEVILWLIIPLMFTDIILFFHLLYLTIFVIGHSRDGIQEIKNNLSSFRFTFATTLVARLVSSSTSDGSSTFRIGEIKTYGIGLNLNDLRWGINMKHPILGCNISGVVLLCHLKRNKNNPVWGIPYVYGTKFSFVVHSSASSITKNYDWVTYFDDISKVLVLSEYVDSVWLSSNTPCLLILPWKETCDGSVPIKYH